MKNNEQLLEMKSIQQSFSIDMNNDIQPPTPWCSTVKWGAHHLFDIKLSNSIIYSCFPLTDYYTNIGSNTSIQGRINDFVAITSNSIIRFDGETRAIKEISKNAYCTGVYIPIHDVIVAVSATTSHFNFIRPEDMKHPIESEFRSMQFPCFHINFLKKSHVLITSGNDIRIWNLKCVLPSRNIITIKPQINISLRATIEIGFEFNYLNPPCIDYLNELIILPKGSGFSAYNINGQLIKEMTKLPATSQTLVSFLPNEDFETNKNKKMSNQKSSQKLYYQPSTYLKNSQLNNSQDEKKDSNQNDNSVLVTADSEYGVCEWTPNGTLKKRHTSGNSNIIALRLINKSFFLYIDIKNKIYIVDMLARTPRMFLVATASEKPLSMVLYQTNSVSSAFQFGLALCINTSISIYQIVVPWKLFAPSLIKPTLIKLCPRRNRAARIQVQTSNSDLYLLSPKTAQPITSAAPSNPKKIIDTLYDRGLLAKEVRDQLIIVVENGEIVCFSTANIPCDMITAIDDHAAAVFLAYANKSIFGSSNDDFTENENNNINDIEKDNENNSNLDVDQNSEKELCYCVATQNGEIFLCDYNSFKCKKRYIIQTGIVKTAKYDMTYGTVIMSYLNMLLRFDIQNGVILEKLKQVPSGVVTCLEKGILLIGYESGKIVMIKIKEKKMEIMKSEGVSYHTSAVTGFSFGSNFFLSSSVDQTIKIWSLKGETVGVISLPLPLYGIEIYNGKRDILVGTDKEIMVIEGRSIFMDEFEKKDDILDNYNEKDDELSNDAISPLQKQEEEKQAFLVARKAEEQETENKNRKKEEETKNNVVYLNNQNKRTNNNYNNAEKSTTQKKEMDEETRKRIIEQMTKITSNSTLSTRIAERERVLLEQKTQQIENEYKQEKELRRLQGEVSLEEQEIALKRRKEETILRRKREQEEKERKIKEQKEKEERERREKKEREERERKEREEQERKEREERERLEREEQERLEREEQERLEREEQERLEQEERERLEREEQERKEKEEKEKIEREEKERIEREEKERIEREEQERKEKEEKERLEKEKEIQNQKIIIPPDDDPTFQAPRKKQSKQKEEGQDKKEEEKKESAPKEKKKKKKSKSPSPPQKSSKNQSKDKTNDTNDEEKSAPLANVITFPNVLIDEKEKTEPQSTSTTQNATSKSSKAKTTKSKGKTAQPKDMKNDSSDINGNEEDKNKEDDDDLSKNLPFKIELAKWISSDGKVYTQSKKGDWSDDQQRLFQRQKNGSFTTTDSVIWRGPTIQKGRFVAAKGGRNFDVICQRFVSLSNNKIYTNLGEDRFSDSDGSIYTKGKDGKYFTDDKKKSWCGPDGNGFFEKMSKPKQIIGSDGKNYKLAKNGTYVCTDKTSKNKNNNNNNNQSFVTEDGVLMLMIDNDTFYGSDGTIYRTDATGKIANSDGKSYEKKIPQPEPEPQQQQQLDASEIAKKLLPESEQKESTKNKKGSKNKGKDNPKNKKNNKSKAKDAKESDKSNVNEPGNKKEDEKANEIAKENEKEQENNQNKDVNDEAEKKEENQKDNANENKVENAKEKDVEVENSNTKENEKKDTENENKKSEEKKEKEDKPNKKGNVKKNAKNKKIKASKKGKKEDENDDDDDEKEDENDDDEKESEKEVEESGKEEEESEKESEKDDEKESEKEEESEKESEKDDEKESEKDEEESEKDEDESEKESQSQKEEESDEETENDENDVDEDYNETEEGDDEYNESYESDKDSEIKSKAENSKSKAKQKENQETKPKGSSKSKSNSKSKGSTDDSKTKSKDNKENANKKNKAKNKNDSNTTANDSSTKDVQIKSNEDDHSKEAENENKGENSLENESNEEKDNNEETINDIKENHEEDEEARNINNGDNEEDDENKEKEFANEDEEENVNEANNNNNNEDDYVNKENVGDDENEANVAGMNENDDAKGYDENENNEEETNENYNEDNGSSQNDETNEDNRNEDNEENNEENENSCKANEEDNNEVNEENENSGEANEDNEVNEDNGNNTETIENGDNELEANDEEDSTTTEANENAQNTKDAINEDENDSKDEAIAQNDEEANDDTNLANEDQINQNEDQNGGDNAEVEPNQDTNQSNEDENGGDNAEVEPNLSINPSNENETASNIDVFKPGEVYTSHDGNEYEKADDSTFIDKSGKSFTLDENGDYVADDGTTMPLSNEQIFYAEPNGSTYRPLPPTEDESNEANNENGESKWINSEGKVFKPTDDSNQLQQNNNNSEQEASNNSNYDDVDVDDVETRPFEQKLVADDGTIWNGPNPATGKFGGKKIKKTPVQWVTNDGVVFIPSNKDKSEWTNSEDKKYVKEKESDSEFVRVGGNENQKEKWEGPVTGKGHWVSGQGKVIDSDKGIWLSPDKKVYTAVKTGYVQNDNGRLYKPFITSQEATMKMQRKSDNDNDENFLVSDDGKDLLKLGEKEGQFISNSGEIYTSVDDDGKEWIDNYGVVYKPHHDGNYFVSSETQQKWQGPPFFNNRKLIDSQFDGFKHDKIKLRYPAAMTLPKRDVVYTNYEVKIGKPRSSTPLYKVPPLKYPPNTHSKYKPFRYRPKTPPGDNGYFYSKFNNQNDNPRRNRLRIMNPFAIPPPNIVVDERQVIRLIERGQRQLIPLLRRIASYDPSNVLARDYLKRLDEQKFSQNRYNNDDIDYNNNNNSDDDDSNTDVKTKYKGKFNIKFDFDLNAVAPTPISNLTNQKNVNTDSNTKNIKSPPEKPKTKSARSFVHYNNVLNPMDNNQDYLNLYINKSRGRTKRKNNEDDDRYIEIDNSYSSNGFYQPRKKAPKTEEKTRPFSVHNVSSDKYADSSIIAQTTNKPKLVIPQSARRQKKP